METTETTTEKIYDITKREYVDKPVDSTNSDKPEDKPVLDKPEDKPVDKPEDKKPEDKPEDKPDFTVEKTQYESQINDLSGKIKELEEQVKNPKFASEQQQKVYQFIQQYPENMWGDGIQTYGQLMSMDTTKISDKDALKEEFILSKPNLSRTEAARVFEARHKRDYVLERDKFDNDETFKEAQELAEIELKDRGAEARAKLAAKQAEFKAKPVEKVETKAAEEPKAPIASVKSYTAEADKFMKTANRITMKDEADDKIAYNIDLSPEVMKNADELFKEYLQRPDIYDKDGKIPNFNPSELFEQFLFLSMGAKAYNKMHFDRVRELARTLTAEQLASTKPDKESKGGGPEGPKSIADQFKDLGQKAVQERTQG